ncbi:hypothetical protein [Streptomyces sp. NPDC001480]|uniref:hypothetical protein n=1 Tax=Streptomyces sp. NPDC001480 TaxID=3364577 RepID=UPI00367B0AAC
MTANVILAEILDRDAVGTEGEQLLAGTPALPGYTSEACRAERLPEAAGAIHCDALRLLDIVERTGVTSLVLHAGRGWARVPAPLLHRTLQRRGRQADAAAFRDALARRVREFPAVRTGARWAGTGAEHLMLRIAVDEQLPSASAQRLMETLLADRDSALSAGRFHSSLPASR